jgi:hypothetical protein
LGEEDGHSVRARQRDGAERAAGVDGEEKHRVQRTVFQERLGAGDVAGCLSGC